MDSAISRLIRGDGGERAILLMDGDSTFMQEVVSTLMKIDRGRYSEDELEELNALNYAYDGEINNLLSKDIPFQEKVKILRIDGCKFIHKMLKPVKRQQRKRKDCPVPGCTSLGLLQLHNHLNCVHRYNEKDRKYWLSIGRLQKSGVLTKELISRENGKRRSHDFSRWYRPRNGFIQNHCTGSETGEE